MEAAKLLLLGGDGAWRCGNHIMSQDALIKGADIHELGSRAGINTLGCGGYTVLEAVLSQLPISPSSQGNLL